MLLLMPCLDLCYEIGANIFSNDRLAVCIFPPIFLDLAKQGLQEKNTEN